MVFEKRIRHRLVKTAQAGFATPACGFSRRAERQPAQTGCARAGAAWTGAGMRQARAGGLKPDCPASCPHI